MKSLILIFLKDGVNFVIMNHSSFTDSLPIMHKLFLRLHLQLQYISMIYGWLLFSSHTKLFCSSIYYIKGFLLYCIWITWGFYRLCLHEYFFSGLEILHLSFEIFIYIINFIKGKKNNETTLKNFELKNFNHKSYKMSPGAGKLMFQEVPCIFNESIKIYLSQLMKKNKSLRNS